VAQTLHRVVRRKFAAANLLEQFADGFGVHEDSRQSALRRTKSRVASPNRFSR
jgi:hypothetical protein